MSGEELGKLSFADDMERRHPANTLSTGLVEPSVQGPPDGTLANLGQEREAAPIIGNELWKPPQGAPRATGMRSEHLFVSNVRFVAMVSIVYVHTQMLIETSSTAVTHLQVALLQLFKFGTISFFLISGFLLGEGLTRVGRMRYFRRRVQVILSPWIFWGMLWFFFALTAHLLGSRHNALRTSVLAVLQEYLQFVFFHSIYWFVPNFFFCLALVIALHKRVPDLVVGAFFLLCSLFYGVNVYLVILPPAHTTAVFGFVFYLWLGMFAYAHRQRWFSWLARTSWVLLGSFAAIAGGLSLIEYHYLSRLHPYGDASNTLRISNQLFSVLVTLLIVKYKRRLSPRFIRVRSETFGIYLLHPILVEVVRMIRLHLTLDSPFRTPNGPLTLFLLPMLFLIVYLTAVFLAKQLGRSAKWAWTVGIRSSSELAAHPKPV